MKALPILLFMAIALGGAFYGYRHLRQPDFPIARTLTSTEGRAIEAVILGKSGDTLHIERITDRTRHDLPIQRLAAADRAFASRLPELAVAPPPNPPKPPEPEDPYIASRLSLIADLERKITEAEAVVAADATMSSALLRKRQEDIVKMRREIDGMRAQIETRRSQSKQR